MTLDKSMIRKIELETINVPIDLERNVITVPIDTERDVIRVPIDIERDVIKVPNKSLHITPYGECIYV